MSFVLLSKRRESVILSFVVVRSCESPQRIRRSGGSSRFRALFDDCSRPGEEPEQEQRDYDRASH
jgi:hypothetical protein